MDERGWSYAQLAHRSDGRLTKSRWQQLGTMTRMKEFPELATVRLLADVLEVAETTVVLSVAASLGIDVRFRGPLLAQLLPAGTDLLSDRMQDAITGELNRRQELLYGANAKNVWDYEKMRENGADLDPLPALFICIDEFSEMLVAKPDFIDIFLQIGRVGRSLQMHMLLASQRLEEGKLRGLDTYLSYRIGLKTFSAAESRAAPTEPTSRRRQGGA